MSLRETQTNGLQVEVEVVAVSWNYWGEVKVVAVVEHNIVNYEMVMGEVEVVVVVVKMKVVVNIVVKMVVVINYCFS